MDEGEGVGQLNAGLGEVGEAKTKEYVEGGDISEVLHTEKILEDGGGQTYDSVAILYTVKLLVPSSESSETDNQQFEDVATESILPFVEGEPDIISQPLPSAFAKDPSIAQNVVAEIMNSIAVEWFQISNYGVCFGPEILRVGDLVRLKDAEKHVAARIDKFRFDASGHSFSILGQEYYQDERFCITTGLSANHSTRVAAWIPRYRWRTLIPMDKIAGRLYLVNHPGLLVRHYLSAMVWQDWKNAVCGGASINIKRVAVAKRNFPLNFSLDDEDIFPDFANLRITGTTLKAVTDGDSGQESIGRALYIPKQAHKRKANDDLDAATEKRQRFHGSNSLPAELPTSTEAKEIPAATALSQSPMPEAFSETVNAGPFLVSSQSPQFQHRPSFGKYSAYHDDDDDSLSPLTESDDELIRPQKPHLALETVKIEDPE
ncbi:hypothetical protein HDU96_003233 [Phlyctochytrium bullatum]|nr:hypothetical protein HDU96_003233 [Phlyctochytrium bullatum]